MATYNFHIREIQMPQINSGALEHWQRSGGTIDNPGIWTINVYDVSKEIFFLYPRLSFSVNKTPTNTTTNLYEFRVAQGIFSDYGFQNNGLFDLNFGNIDVTIADNLVLCWSDPVGDNTFNNTVQLANTVWTSNSWTLSNLSTFKTEITTFLSKCCDNSRALSGNPEPLSFYSDFAIQIYKDGYKTSSNESDKNTFVVFYPGNDPEADEIISVTT